jgi:hypothetical protein
VIQLAAADLFAQIEKDQYRRYKVSVQYFEIYNEQIRDLLADRESRPGRVPWTEFLPAEKDAPEDGGDNGEDDEDDAAAGDDDTVSLVPPRSRNLSPRKLFRQFVSPKAHAPAAAAPNVRPSPRIRAQQPPGHRSSHDPTDAREGQQSVPLPLREVNGVVTVPAVAMEVAGCEDVAQLLLHGARNRAVAAVGAGGFRERASSRSHAIFRMTVESRTSHACSSEDAASRWVSVLNLVDLAGSESTDLSRMTGARRREGGMIHQRYGGSGSAYCVVCVSSSSLTVQ